MRPAPATPERMDNRADRQFDRNSQWDKLGSRWVDGRVDRDVVPVGRRERYQRIMAVSKPLACRSSAALRSRRWR